MSMMNYFGAVTAAMLVSSCVGMSVDTAATKIARAIDDHTTALRSNTQTISNQVASCLAPKPANP